MSDKEEYTCQRCGRQISQEECETYDGMCSKCYEIKIDELDYEDEDY